MHEKWSAHRAARELLAQDEETVLRYVALELRTCIEAVVYEKLWSCREWLPIEAQTWQPPQAFKALLNFEPDAAETRTIAIGPARALNAPPSWPLTTLGTDHRPTTRWLTKTWNKLGHYLHAEWPFSKPAQTGPSRKFLQEVLVELEPFVDSRAITFSFSGPLQAFDCEACGAVNKASETVLDVQRVAYCATCQAKYTVEKRAEGYFFALADGAVECPECRAQIVLPLGAALTKGATVACRKCPAKYTMDVVRCDIRLDRVAENASDASRS